MSQLDKQYNHSAAEKEIIAKWDASDAFKAVVDERGPEKRYVVMMPLPNVTGALHIGHAMDNVMQDMLVRWHRMRGYNTLWQAGTDHAGIATQAVVEKRLKELEGKTRHDIGRDALIQKIWDWKDQYQQRIISQQKRMGCSCDWQRQRFTMDAVCTRAVRHAFFQMYDDGLIFRGKRLVNWDVKLQTSVSDDEVYHKEVDGHFYHLRYPVIEPKSDEPRFVVVATTRPETMFGDVAVAVHPDPAGALAKAREKLERQLSDLKLNQAETAANVAIAEKLAADIVAIDQRVIDSLAELETLTRMAKDGRHINLPLVGRAIPLVCDEWAKPMLGSGAVKITPAHDPNDYEVWRRRKKDGHDLGRINVLNKDGSLNQEAGALAGLSGKSARKAVIDGLKAIDCIERIEDRKVEVGHSDRSKTVIEPMLSDQWFVHMGDRDGGIEMGRGSKSPTKLSARSADGRSDHASGLVQAAIDAVENGRVRIFPERYRKTYIDWLSEKRDWPISRQLWWGHQIPVWSKDETMVVLMASLDRILAFRKENQCVVKFFRISSDGGLTLVVDAELNSLPEDGRLRIEVCPIDDGILDAGQLESLGFVREADVLDTWFSSALWPMSTLGWPDAESAQLDPGNRPLADQGYGTALDYYYPGSCLVTGRDIISLWVARMVIMGVYLRGEAPFRDVFIHANILDGKGERMSKSKGNGIDPVDIIESYGTDALRYVLCMMQTGSQDIRLPVTAVCPNCKEDNDLAKTKHGKSIFSYICTACNAEYDVLGSMQSLPQASLTSKRFDVGKAFCNKLWNSGRFILEKLESTASVSPIPLKSEDLQLEDKWILTALNECINNVHQCLSKYDAAQAIQSIRNFFWSDFCDWYLELVKPRLSDSDTSSASLGHARQILIYCFDQVLRLLHPFTPFITETLWTMLADIVPDDKRLLTGIDVTEGPIHLRIVPLLCHADFPRLTERLDFPQAKNSMRVTQDIVSGLREMRQRSNVPSSEALEASFRPLPIDSEVEGSSDLALEAEIDHNIVIRLASLSSFVVLGVDDIPPTSSAMKIVGGVEVFLHGVVDAVNEKEKLTKEKKRVLKEIGICEKKLGNESFVDRAPKDVVEEQRSRLADYKATLARIDASLESF